MAKFSRRDMKEVHQKTFLACKEYNYEAARLDDTFFLDVNIYSIMLLYVQ